MFPDPLGDFLANAYFAATAGFNPNASFAEFNAILGAQAGSFGINQFYTNLGFAIATGGLLGGVSSPQQFTNFNEQLPGTAADDIIFAEGGDDIVDGWLGNDYLAGAVGNDWLLGNIGDDYLVGRTGTDFLEGGVGSDVLIGGSEADIYIYNSPFDGGDFIADFNWEPNFGFMPEAGDLIAINTIGFSLTVGQENRFSYQFLASNQVGSFGGLFFDQTLIAALPLASEFDPTTDIVFF